MLTRRPSVATAGWLFFTLLSGCSLQSGNVSQALHLDLSKLANARVGSTAQSTTSTYACLGVSVTGFEVADSPGLQCGHPGVVAGPLSTSTSAVDVMVPTGLARKVTVFGIADAALCSTFDANSLHAAKSLGSSSSFDFFDDASVSVNLDFNGALAFPDCSPSVTPTGTPSYVIAGTGLVSNPHGMAIDSASGVLYVASYGDSSIKKFDLVTGNLIGAIGKIATSPTGGASGCNGANAGTFTPGWCTGGTFSSGTGDGMLSSPSSIAFDSTGPYLYVTDTSNHRVVKYHATTGNFMGWIGGVATMPTGGVAGCSSTAGGGLTPGWCLGGTSSTGNTDGRMSGPTGIAIDSSGYIYVADTGNHRINKYNSSGAFQGWIGAVATTPTAGTSGCSVASVVTPGWCTGGVSTHGTGDGMLSSPQGISISSGELYVADTANHRISRYNVSTGAFDGWIGNINTSPTSGATGCYGAAVGTATPGWCMGGGATLGAGDGMLKYPDDVSVDASGIYVSNQQNNRIDKFNSSGEFQGWIGRINASPTGGAIGCVGAAIGSITLGWCRGGSATSNPAAGALTNPAGVIMDSTGHIYVTDSTHGLQRFF